MADKPTLPPGFQNVPEDPAEWEPGKPEVYAPVIEGPDDPLLKTLNTEDRNA